MASPEKSDAAVRAVGDLPPMILPTLQVTRRKSTRVSGAVRAGLERTEEHGEEGRIGGTQFSGGGGRGSGERWRGEVEAED